MPDTTDKSESRPASRSTAGDRAQQISRQVRTLLLAIGLALAAAPALLAYGGDTHYYLRFATALETCFDWDEAHLIAANGTA